MIFHIRSNAHLMAKNILQDASSDCGAAVQNMDHLFFGCPLYGPYSDRLILSLCKAGIDHDANIATIAFSGNAATHSALVCFVRDTNIKIG